MALLFSDPTASGLKQPEQILVRGAAICPDEIRVRPEGDLEAFWELLMARQPHSQSYLDWPMTAMTDFYHMRLLVTVTPTEIVERPLPVPARPKVTSSGSCGRPGRPPSGTSNAVDWPVRWSRGRTTGRSGPGSVTGAECPYPAVGFLILSRATLGQKAVGRYGKVNVW
ncbi:hypothetical protein [Actinoplanes philippinensis]|uniref:hypothetical protein n=1 Tax=Actinoplanes philippinensis TaxID=35752 RepID=UPI0034022F86